MYSNFVGHITYRITTFLDRIILFDNFFLGVSMYVCVSMYEFMCELVCGGQKTVWMLLLGFRPLFLSLTWHSLVRLGYLTGQRVPRNHLLLPPGCRNDKQMPTWLALLPLWTLLFGIKLGSSCLLVKALYWLSSLSRPLLSLLLWFGEVGWVM